MGRVITSPGVLKNVQGQIDHVTDMYDDIKDNNLKPLTVTLDPVSNANGAYSHTTEDERITEDMKPVTLEVGTPECFYAPVTVSTANGSATVQCTDAHGNSTITVTFVKTSPVTGGADYPPAVTSTEFDILADRIGALTDLDTTDKSSIVNAVNEVIDSIDDVNNKITPVTIYETTLANLNSRVLTICNSLGTGGNQPVYVRGVGDAGAGMRNGSYYTGWIMKNTDNYGSCFLIHFTGEQITGNINNGTVTWSSVTDHIANIIGSLVEGTNAQSLSVPDSTFTVLSTMLLTKGTWIITGGFQYDNSFSSDFIAQLRINGEYIPGTKLRVNGNSGGGANISWITKITSTNTYVYLVTYQGTGSDKPASNVALRAMRIA